MHKFLLIVICLLALTTTTEASVGFPPSASGGAPGGSSSQIQFNNAGALGGISPTSLLTTIDNQTATLLPKWRKALANVLNGTGNATVYIVGDSTMIGQSNGATNPLLASPPARLTQLLNSRGINAHFNTIVGWNTQLASDTRTNNGGSWSTTGSPYSIGGNNNYVAGSTTATPMQFTPAAPVDTFVFYWYSQGAGAGTFSYAFDGGSATNIIISTTPGVYSQTVTVPSGLGIHTAQIKWVSGTDGYIGFSAYDSSKKWVAIYNGGAGGATTATWNNTTGNAFTGISTLTSLNQDLTIIDLGINDWCTGVSVSTYTTNMQAIITKALTVGDVVIVSPVPSNPASGSCTSAPSNATQQTYVNALYALAASNSIPIIDTFGRWVSYTSSNAFGYYAADGIHPLALGIVDQTRQIDSLLSGYGTAGFLGSPTFNGLVSLGNVGIGTATPQNGAALTVNGLITSMGTAPVASSCGSGTVDTATYLSTDERGGVTGITAATACTLTFNHTWPYKPACIGASSAGLAYPSAISTTAVTFTMPSLTGTMTYSCN